jgi:hypothetical protein
MSEWQSMHPEDGELLRYADGELSRRQARRVRAHLARCWQCRAALGQIERTVRRCVEYRQAVLETTLPEPPAPWFDIRRRLAELEAAGASEPPLSRLRRGLAWGWITPPRVAVAAVLAALVWAQATLIFRSREPARPAPAVVRPAPAPPAPSGSEPAPAPAPAPRSAAPPVVDLREGATPGDELRVFALLRRLGADLGEPVEVTRQGGRVLVSGIGISPEVERALSRELAASPRFSVRFSPPARDVPPAERPASTITVQPEITRLQSELEQRLGGRAAYDELANALLETIDGLLAHLHALRRLAERFPPEVESGLSRPERALLASLLGEHAAAVARLAAVLEERSRPVFSSQAPPDQPAAGATPAKPWQSATEELLGSARRTESLLAAILGGSASPEPAATLPGKFLRSVEQLRRLAEAFLRDAAG